MLRLNLKKEPYWLELPANVKVKVRPLSTAIMSAAQNCTIKQMNDLRQQRQSRLEIGADVNNIPNVEDEQTRLGFSESLLVKALARFAVMEWQGVLTPDGTAPALLNDQSIHELMDIWFIAQEFWKQYSSELSLLEAEGNGSKPVANGISAGAQAIAKDAVKKDFPVAEGNVTN